MWRGTYWPWPSDKESLGGCLTSSCGVAIVCHLLLGVFVVAPRSVRTRSERASSSSSFVVVRQNTVVFAMSFLPGGHHSLTSYGRLGKCHKSRNGNKRNEPWSLLSLLNLGPFCQRKGAIFVQVRVWSTKQIEWKLRVSWFFHSWSWDFSIWKIRAQPISKFDGTKLKIKGQKDTLKNRELSKKFWAQNSQNKPRIKSFDSYWKEKIKRWGSR